KFFKGVTYEMIELSQGQFQLSNNPPYYLFRNDIPTNLYGTSNGCWQRFLNDFIFGGIWSILQAVADKNGLVSIWTGNYTDD
ncbi:10858_t:CDS:2, partial [Dentiscutata erythropus]